MLILTKSVKVGMTTYLQNAITDEFDKNHKKANCILKSFGICTYIYNELIEKDGNVYFYIRVPGRTVGFIRVQQRELNGKKVYEILEVRVNGDCGAYFDIKKLNHNLKKFVGKAIGMY